VRVEPKKSAARERLNNAIRERVADAIRDGQVIRSGPEAARLARTYAGSGLSTAQVSELLVRAALAAGVATELSSSD
jgi:hypothetical protein